MEYQVEILLMQSRHKLNKDRALAVHLHTFEACQDFNCWLNEVIDTLLYG